MGPARSSMGPACSGMEPAQDNAHLVDVNLVPVVVVGSRQPSSASKNNLNNAIIKFEHSIQNRWYL